MSTQADVKSIDTLAFMKAAFASFAHESGQAISECEMQGQRAVDWICVDQAGYWKAEVRRMTELVNKAVKDLEYCKAFKKVGNNQPSCIEEKKALEKAGIAVVDNPAALQLSPWLVDIKTPVGPT
jgi:hypothetical protein